jgi:hypothetical protein
MEFSKTANFVCGLRVPRQGKWDWVVRVAKPASLNHLRLSMWFRQVHIGIARMRCEGLGTLGCQDAPEMQDRG